MPLTRAPREGQGPSIDMLLKVSVKTCKNPIYVAEGGLTVGVKMHTMLTHLTKR